MKHNTFIIILILISISVQVDIVKDNQQNLSPTPDHLDEGKSFLKSQVTDDEITQTLNQGTNIISTPLASTKMAWAEWFNDMENENELDYESISSLLQPIDLDKDLQPMLLPYDPYYKVGQGYNINDGTLRGNPFIADILYEEEPTTYEGSEGDVNQQVIMSAKDFAIDIYVAVAGKYKGLGVKGAAAMSMDSSYSIQSDEVILKATHHIDRGKVLYTQDALRFQVQAKTQLATDQEGFENNFGTHFIVGYTQECDMDIFYRRTATSEDLKVAVAASMSQATQFWAVAGEMETGVQQTEDMESTTIDVKYRGTDGETFFEGLNIQQLQAAVVDFPNHCIGNIRDYILWPYYLVQDYDFVESTIKFTQDMESQQADEEVFSTEVNILEDVTDAIDVLDGLFTTAIIEVKIIKNSLDKQVTYTQEDSQEKKDQIFEFDLYEMVLYDTYDKYNGQLELSNDRYDDIVLLRQAKAEVDAGQLTVESSTTDEEEVLDALSDHLDTSETYSDCNVDLCSVCTTFSDNYCDVCDSGLGATLTTEGKCEGWMTIFKQSSLTYNTQSDWMNLNDDDAGRWGDDYSILHRIDDNYRNSEYKFEFKLSWEEDYAQYEQHWQQSDLPWISKGASVQLCPIGTWVYHSGSHCCNVNSDKSGDVLTYEADNCMDDSYIACPYGATDGYCTGNYEDYDQLDYPDCNRIDLYDDGTTDGCNSVDCERCQGECDSDDQCAGDLLCFQRSYSEAVTGCSGFGLSTYDYCYDPNCGVELDAETVSGFDDLGSHFTESFQGLTYGTTTLMKGANPFWEFYQVGTSEAVNNGITGPTGVIDASQTCDSYSCDVCQGFCTDDTDCLGDLICQVQVGEWVQKDITITGAIDLSVGANGEVFVINLWNSLYKATPDAVAYADDGSSLSWTALEEKNLKVSADPNGDIVTIGTDQSVHRYQGTTYDDFSGDSFVDAGVGSDYTICACRTDGRTHRNLASSSTSGDSYEGWTQETTFPICTRMDAGLNGQCWMIDDSATVWRTQPTDDVTYEEVVFDGAAVDISVGSDGAVAIVDSYGQVFTLNNDDTWTEIPVPASMTIVAVGSADNIWAVDSDGAILRLLYDLNPSVPGCSWVGQEEMTGNFCYDPDMDTSTTQQVELSVWVS